MTYRGSNQHELDQLIAECDAYYHLQRTRKALAEAREASNKWAAKAIEANRRRQSA